MRVSPALWVSRNCEPGRIGPSVIGSELSSAFIQRGAVAGSAMKVMTALGVAAIIVSALGLIMWAPMSRRLSRRP
jgi:hypothetical protein